MIKKTEEKGKKMANRFVSYICVCIFIFFHIYIYDNGELWRAVGNRTCFSFFLFLFSYFFFYSVLRSQSARLASPLPRCVYACIPCLFLSAVYAEKNSRVRTRTSRKTVCERLTNDRLLSVSSAASGSSDENASGRGGQWQDNANLLRHPSSITARLKAPDVRSTCSFDVYTTFVRKFLSRLCKYGRLTNLHNGGNQINRKNRII